MEGEVRIAVTDPDGQSVAGALVRLAARNPEFAASTKTGALGLARFSRLPLGRYRLNVTRDGFETWTGQIDVRSAVPREIAVQLQVGAIRTQMTVSGAAPLLDRAQPLLVMHANRSQLEETAGSTLDRALVDVITTMPGWLLESGAVLHPRGSEYDTQYVIDGMPLYDNRSIAFAPAFENEEFEQINVITAGIPAEYGRRLGGVIALDTRRQGTLGHATEASYQRGSYSTLAGEAAHSFRTATTAASLRTHGGWTDRYLDPPSLDNFTNRASAAGVDSRLDRHLTPAGRLNLYFRSNRTNFLVPNDPTQQEAGQRQDRRSAETAGQVHYQHTFSPGAIGSVRAMVRDISARLWSNPLATPVHIDQDRGFREAAIIASSSLEREYHSIKFGGDFRSASIHEQFDLARDIDFRGRRRSSASSAFVQDYVRWGAFAANIGLRVDRYSLFETENAASPRLAASYFLPKANLLLRASYDRVFQPAPIENLLFSTAAASLDIEGVEGALAVPASRGNFFEVGFRKPLGNVLRFDASHYWRRFRNYSDDDVFFNTGIGFPISFDRAEVRGTELRLDMPRRRGVSAFASYSNMIGHATSPVTGGLFIEGGEALQLRDLARRFPITQDQRNTFAGQLRVQPHPRFWLSTAARYGSGLPFESDDDADTGGGEDEFPQQLLHRVDFSRGRLRPNFSLNLSAGVRVMEAEGATVSMQFDVRNLTDRLNLINFSGVFSGTAIAPGRQASFQLRARF